MTFATLVALATGLSLGAQTPASRALPSPLEAPPFPSSDWAGAPIIGLPDTTPDYPLQKRLFGEGHRIKLYGWLNAGGNISTSKDSNIPMAYDVVPNSFQLDQAVLRVERPLDTVQQSHVDWGFRVTGFYGMDVRYTVAKGWQPASDAVLKRNALNSFDPVECYGLLYIPNVGEGFVLKLGRFISPPDIEAQLAPDNYLYTHSLMFSYDPFTFTGLQATLRLNAQWQVEAAIHGGNDQAPWADSSAPSGQLMVRWASKDNQDSIWAGFNMLGQGKYKNGHDNLNMAAITWGHRFNARLHMMTEAYYEWQYDAAMGGNAITGPSKPYYQGVGLGATIPGRSGAMGFVNYFQILLSGKDYLSIRNDFLNDYQGQRTGFQTPYSSHTLGLIHYFNDLLFIRPEVRYERAYKAGATPYDNGRRRNQTSFSMDAILRF